jgi:hypothetical protein
LLKPLAEVIVIFCSLPVPLSLAEALTMPLASISKVTSICGTPRGAGYETLGRNIPADCDRRAAMTKEGSQTVRQIGSNPGRCHNPELVVRRDDGQAQERDRTR